MKIEYKILWLDDQIEEFIEDGFVSQIEEFIEDSGFAAKVTTVSKPDDLFPRLTEDWDLILTDYNMADMNGAEVISSIRDRSIYTEILFYTAQKTWEDLTRIDRISFLQTSSKVVGSHHEVVVVEAKRLISLTIKKFQDIVAMRGLIMHETSTLDAQIDNITQSYLECVEKCGVCPNQEKCKELLDILVPKMKAHMEEKLSIINNSNFKKIRKDNFIYSADYKRLVLGKLLELHDIADFTTDYKNDIVSLRNKFAHAVLQTDTNGRRYFKHKEDGLTFNDALCVKIRRDIRKYKGLIDNAETQIMKK